MKPRWEMVTCWKYDLATEEDSFEYFNEEAFIPGHIYRIHVSNGAPIIVEFKHFGCGYDHSMTKTYPRMLMCDGAADVHIKNITHIFAYNGDDDVSSESDESTKTTADVSGFKDFVVSNKSYRMNEKLKDIEIVSRLSTDKMHIDGELKITGFDTIIDRYPCSSTQGIRFELPTGDEISIPASDHPWVENSGGQNFPVFIEDESGLSWNKDLAAGEFYIMLNRFAEKKFILIRSISNDKIEYNSCTSRYDRNNGVYFVESLKHELMLAYATKCKFIPMNELM